MLLKQTCPVYLRKQAAPYAAEPSQNTLLQRKSSDYDWIV